MRLGDDAERVVTAIEVFDAGAAVDRAVGERRADREALGTGRHPDRRHHRHAAKRRRNAITSRRRRWRRSSFPAHRLKTARCTSALVQLAEQDPLINLRQDDIRNETVRLALRRGAEGSHPRTLADDFGIDVEFRETTTICIERPIGTGAAVEVMREHRIRSSRRSAYASILRRVGSGVRFELEVELGSIRSRSTKRSKTPCRDAAAGAVRLACDRLRRVDDALRLRAAAESLSRALRQEHVEHGADFRNCLRRWC